MEPCSLYNFTNTKHCIYKDNNNTDDAVAFISMVSLPGFIYARLNFKTTPSGITYELTFDFVEYPYPSSLSPLQSLAPGVNGVFCCLSNGMPLNCVFPLHFQVMVYAQKMSSSVIPINASANCFDVMVNFTARIAKMRSTAVSRKTGQTHCCMCLSVVCLPVCLSVFLFFFFIFLVRVSTFVFLLVFLAS